MSIGTSLVIIALIIAVTFLICVALIAYTMLRMGRNMNKEIKRYEKERLNISFDPFRKDINESMKKHKERMDRLQGGFKRGDDL